MIMQSPQLRPGTAVGDGGRYMVDRLIGAGGAGAVFRVRDTRLAGQVRALKVAAPAPSGSGSSDREVVCAAVLGFGEG